MAATVIAWSQDIELNENGIYEKKQVVTVEGIATSEFYRRAMVALSDWKGSDGKSSANIDYQDREAGMVIYKGKFSLGVRKSWPAIWHRYAEFTLKVRCKDGRAQVTVGVQSIYAVDDKGRSQSFTMPEVIEIYQKAGNNRKERMESMMSDIKTTADTMLTAMCSRLSETNPADDDF